MRASSISRFFGVTLMVASLMFVPFVIESSADDDDGLYAGKSSPPGWDKKPYGGVGFTPRGQLKKPGKKDDKFHLVEASIADIHAALQRREITCDRLVRLYFKRIKAYSGHCVKYDTNGDGVGPDYDFYMPSGKGVYLGVVSPIPNAGQVNAFQSLNLRPANYTALGFKPPHDPGPRSETDLVDDDPSMPDALEVAAKLDQELRGKGSLRPLHCIPMVIKDQMDTADLRTTDGSLTQFLDDRPPLDGTLVAKLRAAGAIIIGKANMDEYASGNQRSSYGGMICNPVRDRPERRQLEHRLGRGAVGEPRRLRHRGGVARLRA